MSAAGIVRESEIIPELCLLGGPVHRFGVRLRLVTEGRNTLRLGITLALIAWSVFGLLAFTEGVGTRIFSLRLIGIHVRLLVAVPLMFLCETWVAPEMARFVCYLVRSGLVPADSLFGLSSKIRALNRAADSTVTEGALLLLAFALPLVEGVSHFGRTSSWASIQHVAGRSLSWTTGWYLGFCLPLFRFLVLRWFWRLGLWWTFLWRVQKNSLVLIPIHSDSTAGLGYLEVVHTNFVLLILAFSSVYSAQIAEDISSGAMVFDSLYTMSVTVILFMAALFVAPLGMFFFRLWSCRVTGISEYMGMASRYVAAFDRKWIRQENVDGESQLGTSDLQSLADLTNSVNVVRNMRLIPTSQTQIAIFAASAIAPLAPLLLLKYPLADMVLKLFRILAGF